MRRTTLAVVLLATVATDARGEGDGRAATLVLSFDREGTGAIGFSVADPPGGGLNAAAISRGLIAAIPADWTDLDRRQFGDQWWWFLRRWPAPAEKPTARRFDLTPLLTALRGEGVGKLRLTVMVHRFGDVACNLTAEPAPPGPGLMYIYSEAFQTDRPAPRFDIRFGERPTVPRWIVARAGRWSLALAGLVLLPVLLAAWRVRRLTASAETDRLGHALWRLETHGPLATTLAWFVALGLTGGLAQVAGLLDGPRPAGWLLRWLLLYALPPAAAILLAARIARPALDRLRSADWVGVERLETAAWAAVLRLIAAVLAASTAVFLFDGHLLLGLSTLIVCASVQRIGDALSERQFGKVVDVPDTELAANVRALAGVLGVRVKAVGIVAGATRRAEIYKTTKVVLTPALIEDFARPAVDALVAQGLTRITNPAGTTIAGW